MAEAKAQKADEALQTGNYEVLKRRSTGSRRSCRSARVDSTTSVRRRSAAPS
jgi:hypothetical protein